MNPLADPEDLDEATQTINGYAVSDWATVSLSKHAREQLAKRIIPHDVMMTALATGRCVGFEREEKNGVLRYAYEIEMRDKYGRVTVITAVPGFHRLHVVTSYTDIPD
jgi:hypothetical protein